MITTTSQSPIISFTPKDCGSSFETHDLVGSSKIAVAFGKATVSGSDRLECYIQLFHEWSDEMCVWLVQSLKVVGFTEPSRDMTLALFGASPYGVTKISYHQLCEIAADSTAIHMQEKIIAKLESIFSIAGAPIVSHADVNRLYEDLKGMTGGMQPPLAQPVVPMETVHQMNGDEDTTATPTVNEKKRKLNTDQPLPSPPTPSGKGLFSLKPPGSIAKKVAAAAEIGAATSATKPAPEPIKSPVSVDTPEATKPTPTHETKTAKPVAATPATKPAAKAAPTSGPLTLKPAVKVAAKAVAPSVAKCQFHGAPVMDERRHLKLGLSKTRDCCETCVNEARAIGAAIKPLTKEQRVPNGGDWISGDFAYEKPANIADGKWVPKYKTPLRPCACADEADSQNPDCGLMIDLRSPDQAIGASFDSEDQRPDKQHYILPIYWFKDGQKGPLASRFCTTNLRLLLCSNSLREKQLYPAAKISELSTYTKKDGTVDKTRWYCAKCNDFGENCFEIQKARKKSVAVATSKK